MVVNISFDQRARTHTIAFAKYGLDKQSSAPLHLSTLFGTDHHWESLFRNLCFCI
jgi:hypothetical protein